jgi:hypothetical protein
VEEVKFIRELQNLKVTDLSAPIVLECEISKKDVKLDWYKGKNKIKRDEKFNYAVEDSTVHKLIIENPDADDATDYRAVYEKLETSASLTISGKHFCVSVCQATNYFCI